jgi:hypothetical protein
MTMKKLWLLTGLGGVPAAVYYFFARPQMLKWGVRLGESQRRLPGDEILPSVNLQATRAIDIDAPPGVVWRWLAQMGREGTGWYGIDWLQNGGIPSATYLRTDLQAPDIGTQLDGGFEILMLEPERLMVCAGFGLPSPLGIPYDLTYTYLVEARQGKRSRLIARVRGYAYGLAGRLYNVLAFEPLSFFNTRQQLLNIREMAEACEAAPIAIAIDK